MNYWYIRNLDIDNINYVKWNVFIINIYDVFGICFLVLNNFFKL